MRPRAAFASPAATSARLMIDVAVISACDVSWMVLLEPRSTT
jgi:hypothetical protein